jgi:hypothetical protein
VDTALDDWNGLDVIDLNAEQHERERKADIALRRKCDELELEVLTGQVLDDTRDPEYERIRRGVRDHMHAHMSVSA